MNTRSQAVSRYPCRQAACSSQAFRIVHNLDNRSETKNTTDALVHGKSVVNADVFLCKCQDKRSVKRMTLRLSFKKVV